MISSSGENMIYICNFFISQTWRKKATMDLKIQNYDASVKF